ncbi:MAG: hypothetical protein ACI8W8_004540 [Rhodothermales bacterium]|jgi:hypothetical protein
MKPAAKHFRLAVLLAILASTCLAERSPELQILDRLVGRWENSIEVFGKPPRRSIATREWTQGGEGDFLFETTTDAAGKEEHIAFWTYDRQRKRYRCVTLKAGGPFLTEGRWDAESQTFHFDIASFDQKWSSSATHRFVDPDHAEFTLDFRFAGKKAWNQAGTQNRTERVPKATNPPRSKELQILQYNVGQWNSEIAGHKNRSVSYWSRDGRGRFLVSEESGPDGAEKYSLKSFDQRANLYRGCFLEAAGAGFSRGRWDAALQTMNSEFFLFDLPREADGTFVAEASYRDGIHGTILDQVLHRFERKLAIRLSVGDRLVWERSGNATRPFDRKAIWPLTLGDQTALVQKVEFENAEGRGQLLAVGPAENALPVFFDGQKLRHAEQPALSLHVPLRAYEHGTRVIFWYRLNPASIHDWQANPDASLSPAEKPELVLGVLKGEICLVHADDPSRLIFAVAPVAP